MKKTIIIVSIFYLYSCLSPTYYSGKYRDIDKEFLFIKSTNEIIIDDFEDGDYVDKCAGIWYAINDSVNQGDSECKIRMTTGVSNKGRAIKFEYKLGPRFQYRYAMLSDIFKFPIDFTKYKSISFYLRGSGHKLRIKLWSENVEGWDWHGFTIPRTPKKWKRYTIPFFVFRQEGWGKPQKLDLRIIKRIDFQTASMVSGEEGWFEIDNLKLTTAIDTNYQFKEYTVVKKDKRDNGCFLGVFGAGYVENPELIKSLEKKIGKKFSQIMWYLDWRADFPLKECERLWKLGYSSHITWEAWNVETKEGVKFDDILAGKWDNYIIKWAKSAKKFGKPVFIRWGHEFNGDWYPWSIPKNNFDSEKYKKVFRYIHKKFDEIGATNVLWIWCPMCQSFPKDKRNNFVKAYPGDKYVDWIAIDGYNFGITPGWSDRWLSFDEIFAQVYSTIVVNFPGKPIMIGEFASGPNGGDKAQWIIDAFNSIKEKFKAIKLAIWFNIDKETDWRIDSEPKIASAFKKAVESDYFLTSRDNLFKVKEYVKKEHNLYLSLLKKINPFWEKKILKVPKLKKKLNLDGSLSEWEGNYLITLGQKKEYLVEGNQYSSKDDFSALIGLFWDEENLYIGLKVTDDVPFKNDFKNEEIWRGDCVEIVISVNPQADLKRIGFEEGDYQILVTPGNQKDVKPHIWNVTLKKPVDGIVKVNRWKKGYLMEIKIPFSELGDFRPSAGVKIGFDIAIDDADKSNQRESQAIWFGNSSFYYNPSVWNLIEFVE